MKIEKICLFLGILLISYPFVADWWNRCHHSRVISRYERENQELEEAERMEYFEEAVTYNKAIEKTGIRWNRKEEEKTEYYGVLDMHPDGMMGYIEIPSIDCRLPIYHGTDEEVLQAGAGHIEGSSLPVGGEGSHCILSGHRGLPSSKLFTGLDRVKKGDRFFLHVLGKAAEYEVEQIRIVLPENTKVLQIEENRDLCTLVTCTPYGINTHRLLITGTRICEDELNTLEEREKEEKEVDGIEGGKERDVIGAGIGLFFLLAAFLIFLFLWKPVRADAAQKTEWEKQKTDRNPKGQYEIQMEYPFPGTEFFLYRVNVSLGEGANEEKILVASEKVKEDKTLCFSGLSEGRYFIEGEKTLKDGYWYVPAGTELLMEQKLYGNCGKVVIIPKYEKIPMEEPPSDSTEEPPKEEEHLPEGKLPQTGQLWWPVLFGIIGGCLCFIPWRRKNNKSMVKD